MKTSGLNSKTEKKLIIHEYQGIDSSKRLVQATAIWKNSIFSKDIPIVKNECVTDWRASGTDKRKNDPKLWTLDCSSEIFFFPSNIKNILPRGSTL